jgi:tetratricopeptide (TPR) repeat protein
MKEALLILSQVGQGLYHAHLKNTVHRDLKPDNILFKDSGWALLADFGIAVVIEKSGPQMVENAGTPPYMAPEQLNGTFSFYSDQYSLGCIAYELFTGSRPYRFQNTGQPPRPLIELNPQIPARVERAVLKALEKRPEDRHIDILAFLKALGITLQEANGSLEQRNFYSLANASRQPDNLNAHALPTVRAEATKFESMQIADSQQTVDQYLQKGDQLYKQQKYDEALRVFEQATDLDSKSAEAHYRRGQALEKLGYHIEANAAYDQALTCDAKFARAYIGKGNFHAAFHHYEAALHEYQQAARVDRKFSQAYYKIGQALMKLDRFLEAISANDSALRFDPHSAKINQQRGLLLQQLNRHDEALAHYDHSISIMPEQLSFYSGKVELLKSLERHNEAIETYDLLIERMPDVIEAYYGKIELLELTERYDEAVLTFDQIILISPNALNVYYDKADFLKRHQCYDEALDIYDQTIAITTTPIEALNKKIEILIELKRSRELLAAYNQLLGYLPDDPTLYQKKIVLLQRFKRYTEALEANELLLQLEPESTEILFQKADLLEALDRNKEAVETCESIIALGHDQARAFHRIGQLLAKEGPVSQHFIPFPTRFIPAKLVPVFARFHPNNTYLEALKKYEKACQLAGENDIYRKSTKSAIQALGKFHEASILEKEDPDWGDRHGHLFWSGLFNILNALVFSIFIVLLSSSLQNFVITLFAGIVVAILVTYLSNIGDKPYHLKNAFFLLLPPLVFGLEWSIVIWIKTQSFIDVVLLFLGTFILNSLAALVLDMYGIEIYAQFLGALLLGFIMLLESCWSSIRETK